jgi:tripeptidyl-peptidase-1
MAANNFLNEFTARPDVEKFLQTYRPEAVAGASAFEVIGIAGGTTQQTAPNVTQIADGTGQEGDADTEIMLGFAWPTPMLVYSTGGR